jgi:N-acyl-D-amino-acid deacylase
MEGLRDPAIRESARPAIEAALAEGCLAYFAALTQPENKWMEGKRVREVWRRSGKPLADFVLDLLIEESLGPLLVYPWDGSAEENEAALRRTLTHPLQMVITDGVYVGTYPNPRGWGTYSRILGRYVREKGWLRLEDAIRRMTSFPATRFGLDDRGLLRKGMAADMVIFDPQTVGARATYEHPRRPSVGIEHVFVNGVSVLKSGEPTAQHPGRVLGLH